MTIQRQAVQSSNIASVGYDPSARELEVEFRNGGVYRYAGVADDTYRDFVESDSLGRHFARSIKPHHACRRVVS